MNVITNHLNGVMIPVFNNATFTLYSQINTMTNFTNTQELEKSKSHIIVEILEYIPNSTLTMTIIKKTTGNIMVTSMDVGEELAENISPFDTFIQIIDGSARVEINHKSCNLSRGEGIIIPAHAPHRLSADVQFKMISTVFKSGYEN